MIADEETLNNLAGRVGVSKVVVVMVLVRQCAQPHMRGTHGSRTSTSSGSRAPRSSGSRATASGVSYSRARRSYSTTAGSLLARESAGIGLAKAEVAATTIRLVSDRRLKRVVALTKSQKSGKDADELHRSYCGGGFACRG